MSERITLVLDGDGKRVTDGYVVQEETQTRFQALNPDNPKEMVVWHEEDGERKTLTTDVPWRWSVIGDITEDVASIIVNLHSNLRYKTSETQQLSSQVSKAQEWLTEYILGSMDKDEAIAEMDGLMDILDVERYQEVSVRITATWSGYVEVPLGEEFDEAKVQLASSRIEAEYDDFHFYDPDVEVEEE